MTILRVLALVIGALLVSQPAMAEPHSCQIGKPSYCFKYGGALCEKWNARADAKSACVKWTGACIDCHGKIPACLGHRRPPADSPQCSRCSAAWHACMNRIDARFWPNRMSGHN